MAHIRQKFSFGPLCCFSAVFGLHQCHLDLLALRDISRNAHQPCAMAFGIEHGRFDQLQIHRFAGLGMGRNIFTHFHHAARHDGSIGGGITLATLSAKNISGRFAHQIV